MCNHRLPVTEETKKDQVVFWKYFREHFYELWDIQKVSNSFPEVHSGGFLLNVNRSRNCIFPEYYLTLFQITLLLCIIRNYIKKAAPVFSVNIDIFIFVLIIFPSTGIDIFTKSATFWGYFHDEKIHDIFNRPIRFERNSKGFLFLFYWINYFSRKQRYSFFRRYIFFREYVLILLIMIGVKIFYLYILA